LICRLFISSPNLKIILSKISKHNFSYPKKPNNNLIEARSQKVLLRIPETNSEINK